MTTATFPEFVYIAIDDIDEHSDPIFIVDPVEANLAEMNETRVVARYKLVEVSEIFGGIVHTKKVGP